MASEPARSFVSSARKTRTRAKAGYSDFKVGAALQTNGRTIYSGCNIENASYGLSVCAKRVALLKAESEGVKEFRALAVVTGAERMTPPCGAYRQLLWEYCGDIEVHLAKLKGKRGPSDWRSYCPTPSTKGICSVAVC